jgi:hypothetical protein
LNSGDSQTEPKKRSRRFYLVLVAVILLIEAVVGVAVFEFSDIGNIHYGPGPVYIDEVTTDRPYYLQGEEVNLTVTVNNPQDWPVPEPSYVGYAIEKGGLFIEQCGVFIDYAMPIPTFPAHSRTLYSPPAYGKPKVRPGNYTLIVSFDGGSNKVSGNCTLEIRPNPAGFNYTEGIMVGDWVKYDVSVSWTGSGTEPSSVAEFKQMEWIMDRFQSVSNNYMEFNLTIHFKNGTDVIYPLTDDLIGGNAESWLIFPSGLKKGDTFLLSGCAPGLQNFIPDYVPSVVNVVINDTITRNYAGSNRSVNVLSLTSSNGGFESGTLIWDQKTGVLLEFVQRASLPDGTVQWSYKASETNMW